MTAVIDFVDAVPDDVLVISTRRTWSSSPIRTPYGVWRCCAGRPNVVVLRTFSKAYGLAGFRVGYCVAEPELAGAVRAVSLPFGVSIAAQAAALASLAAEDALLERVADLVEARDELAQGCGIAVSTCPTPRATSSGCRPVRGPPSTPRPSPRAG